MAPINRPIVTRGFLNTKTSNISTENTIVGKNITYTKRKAENSPLKHGNFKRSALNEITNDKKSEKIEKFIKSGKSCLPVNGVSEKDLIKKSNLSVLENRSKINKPASGIRLQGPFKGRSNGNPPCYSDNNDPLIKNLESLKSKPSTKPLTRTSIATRSSLTSKLIIGKTVKSHRSLEKSAVEKIKVHQDSSDVYDKSDKPLVTLSKLRSRPSTVKNESNHRTSLRRSLRNCTGKNEHSFPLLTLTEEKSNENPQLTLFEAKPEEPEPIVKLRRSLRNNTAKTEDSTRIFEENHDVNSEPKVSRRSSTRLSLRKSLSADKSTENGSLYISALEEINNSLKESGNNGKLDQFYQLSEFDKELLHDPQQVSLYAMEIFDYLKSREAHFPISDYMGRQPHIDRKMRAMLVDWMVEVQENFELNHETLYLSVKLVDSYLNQVEIRKESLQLVGAAALFLSCKYDERLSPLIDEFEYVGDGAYDKNRLLTMEQSILRHVNYQLSFPISYSFLRRYARCARIQMPLLTLARYILELGLMEYETITLSDSKQAAAALYLAFKMVKYSVWTDSLKYYTGYDVDDFKHIVLLFNRILHQEPSSQLMTIRKKYSHDLFFNVAKTPLISDDELKSKD